jgi:hypothetical protein
MSSWERVLEVPSEPCHLGTRASRLGRVAVHVMEPVSSQDTRGYFRTIGQSKRLETGMFLHAVAKRERKAWFFKKHDRWLGLVVEPRDDGGFKMVRIDAVCLDNEHAGTVLAGTATMALAGFVWLGALGIVAYALSRPPRISNKDIIAHFLWRFSMDDIGIESKALSWQH